MRTPKIYSIVAMALIAIPREINWDPSNINAAFPGVIISIMNIRQWRNHLILYTGKVTFHATILLMQHHWSLWETMCEDSWTRPSDQLWLQWHHNERGDVSNHQPHDCLLNRLYLFRCISKKASKLRVTGLCDGNPPVTGGSPHKGLWHGKCFHLMTPSWKKLNNTECIFHRISCNWLHPRI